MSAITEEIFQEIKNRMKKRGMFSEQEYYDLIEEVLDEYSDQELIVDDDDVVEIEEDLKNRWLLLKKEGL